MSIGPRTSRGAAALSALLLGLIASPSRAQVDAGLLRVEVGVDPAVVTVGEPFRSVLRVTAPSGVSVEYGSVQERDSVQAIATHTVGEDGAGVPVATYELVAWAAGDSIPVVVVVRLVEPDGQVRVQSVRLRTPSVRSVLPAGGAEVQPRPAKSLFVPPLFGEWSYWWLLALLLAGIVAGIVGYRMLAHRRREEETPVYIDPRVWAMAQLDALDSPEAGPLDPSAVVHRSTWIIRTYLYRVEPACSADLTTAEILARFGSASGGEAGLARLLDRADRVKFAGTPIGRDAARELVDDARAWVSSFPPEISGSGAQERAA
ncbi:MAG: hypothetical protein WD766_15475 [Gemmatimonadota bacterium]